MSTPSPQDLLSFIASHPAPVSMREIAQAFHLKNRGRTLVRDTLKDLESQGTIVRKGKMYYVPGRAPATDALLASVVRVDEDGVWVKPDHAHKEGQEFWLPDRRHGLRVGDKALIKPMRDERAALLRALPQGETRTALGLFERVGDGGLFISLQRKDRLDYVVAPKDCLTAEDGDFVEAVTERQGSRRAVARITKVFGPLERGHFSPSDLAIEQYAIPHTFSQSALADANKAKPLGVKGREDLRHIPLITIDDEDARDFDDAVWASPDSDPRNSGGWSLLVAIADVAAYVAKGSALDKTAYERGNSVYFPDKVVPMLPEALSNELCSLKPHEDRACLAVFMTISKDGKLISRRFVRGLMRSAARTTYRQVQLALDGDETVPFDAAFIQNVIKPLYGAYGVLKRARETRGALELNLPEQKAVFNDEGELAEMRLRPRFDSHRLIEEFMVLANVAAASTLDDAKLLCLYRIHDRPTEEKLEGLRDFLKNSPLELSKGQGISPKIFNRLIERAQGSPMERAVNELVLRTQAQAEYNPENIGHFGLGLARYAHFTSPIRRYADLLVHRALLEVIKHPDRQPFDYSLEDFQDTGEHLSKTERRAAQAERETLERYQALYMADRVGETFEGYVSGVTDFALFITLAEGGISGILPLRDLPSDYYSLDAKNHRVVGRRTKRAFGLGDQLKVRLHEAVPLKGALSFVLASTKMSDFSRRKAPKHRDTRASLEGDAPLKKGSAPKSERKKRAPSEGPRRAAGKNKKRPPSEKG